MAQRVLPCRMPSGVLAATSASVDRWLFPFIALAQPQSAAFALLVTAAGYLAAANGEAKRVYELGKSAWPRGARRRFVLDLLGSARSLGTQASLPQLCDALSLVEPRFAELTTGVAEEALATRSIRSGAAKLVCAVGAFGVAAGDHEGERDRVTAAGRGFAPESQRDVQVRLGLLKMMVDEAGPEIVVAIHTSAAAAEGSATWRHPPPSPALLHEAAVVGAGVTMMVNAGKCLDRVYDLAMPKLERDDVLARVAEAHVQAWHNAATSSEHSTIAASLHSRLADVDPEYLVVDHQTVVDAMRRSDRQSKGGPGNLRGRGIIERLANDGAGRAARRTATRLRDAGSKVRRSRRKAGR